MVKLTDPRGSCQYVALSASKNIIILEAACIRVAGDVYAGMSNRLNLNQYWRDLPLHPKESDENAINWIFLVDSINFCFWPEKDKEWAVTYKGEEYSGYWAIPAIINRAIDQNIPMTKPEYYGHLSLEQVKNIFRAHVKGKPKEPVEMPMLEERWKIMNTNGQLLAKKYDNNFSTLVLKAKKNAKALLQIIIDNFPSFRDEAIYSGRKIGFYKRAQLLIADIYACYDGKNLGRFDDIQDLTIFADHGLPPCLSYLKVIKYEDELMQRLKRGEEFEYGDSVEVEIRAVAIHAVELIKNEITRIYKLPGKQLPHPVTSLAIHFYLWEIQRTNPDAVAAHTPFHKCRTIYY